MSTDELRTVAQIVSCCGLRSGEDVLRTLSQGKQPLEQRIALARAVFDPTALSADQADVPELQRLGRISSTLVRKNERLAEWLFSAMLRELKGGKGGKGGKGDEAQGYRAYRDAAAMVLLGDMVERMCASGPVEVRVVFRGLVTTLVCGALGSGNTDAAYVAAVGRLWTLAVEHTADGQQDALAHGDQVARVLGLAATRYFATDSAKARGCLLNLALSAAAVVRGICASSGARRVLALVNDELLAQLLRLSGSLGPGEPRTHVLDTLHLAAFPAEATVQLAMHLADSTAGDQRPDASTHMASRVLTTVSRCMATEDPRALAHYTEALPRLLERFLRALAQVCPETLGRRQPGVVPVAARDAGHAALGMFQRLRATLPHTKGAQRLRAAEELAHVYFRDAWFGSLGSRDIGAVRGAQEAELARWLSADVLPALGSPKKEKDHDAEMLAQAFSAAHLALDAGGPRALHPLGTQLVTALAHAPPQTHPRALALLAHMSATAARMRTLDEFFALLVQADSPAAAAHNTLLAAEFQQHLAGVVARDMPFAQAVRVPELLAGALAREADVGEPEDRKAKKRKLDGRRAHTGRMETLAVLLANFAPAGAAAAANTEAQRTQYAQALFAAHTTAARALSSAPDAAQWAWLLVHHTLVDVCAARTDAADPWLARVLAPRAVRDTVLERAPKDDPRARPLSMLVALQCAAHWAAATASADGADGDCGRTHIERMVREALDGVCHVDGKAAWGLWDGRAVGIDAQNSCTAAWRLLAARLPLVCEFAGPQGVQRLADVLAHRLFAGDRATLDAGFYEIPSLRPLLAPALARQACILWTEHAPAEHPALAELAGGSSAKALDMLFSTAPRVSPRPEPATRCWTHVLHALLHFPPAYWPADALCTVLALAVFIDRQCAADEPSTLARQLVARLARRPQTANHLSPHVLQLASMHPTATDQQAAATRHMLAALAAALLHAALQGTGAPALAADTACRELCTHLLQNMHKGVEHAVVALDVLGAVARTMAVAAANNPRALRRNCPAPEQWLGLARLCGSAEHKPDAVLHVARRGVRACARTLRRCLGDDLEEPAESPKDVTPEDPVLALALLLDAVHMPSALPPTHATKLLSHLSQHLHHALATPLAAAAAPAPVLQAFATCIAPQLLPHTTATATDTLPSFITRYGVTPLLQRMRAEQFDTTLVRLLKLTGLRSRAAPRLLRAAVHAAWRPATSATGTVAAGVCEASEKRRMVQRRVGSILAALRSALTSPTAHEALHAAASVVLEPGIRLSPHDTSAVVALATEACMLPAVPPDPATLYHSVCRLLGALVIHHAGGVLSALPTLVATLRVLLHAFIAAPTEKAASSGASSPWILACTLPHQCAADYARVLSALARMRPHEPPTTGHQQPKKLVALTRGTRAANVAAALSPLVTLVLAEYCIVQAAGARSLVAPRPQASRTPQPDLHAFDGFAWRPTAVTDASTSELPLNTRAGIISDPNVRDALLPGWYALFDVISDSDRAALLALLAADSRGSSTFGGTSVFGPQTYAGAAEVLKTLHQSYRDYYKYKGNV